MGKTTNLDGDNGITMFYVISEVGQLEPEPVDIMCMTSDQALEREIFLTEYDIDQIAENPDEFSTLVASTVKRQRAEVKVKDLSPEEAKEFKDANYKEVDQWIATETVRKVLRDKLPEANILRCRWVLTWKDLDFVDQMLEGRSRRVKARLVILGYEDPDLTSTPQDSPTLQKESRSLLLQMCASMKWVIRSFDITTAFLRGTRRDNRLLGVDPPDEMKDRLQMKPSETCELLKSAYGRVNAPYSSN